MIKNFLRSWLGIDDDVRTTARTIQCLTEHVSNAETLIRERTDCAVDVHIKEASYAILIGHYKGRDYVEAFSIGNADMVSLIPVLKQMRPTSRTRWIDAHPTFRAILDRELSE